MSIRSVYWRAALQNGMPVSENYPHLFAHAGALLKEDGTNHEIQLIPLTEMKSELAVSHHIPRV